VIPIPVDAGGRNEGSQPFEKLKGREQDLGTTVWCRLGEPVQQPGLARAEGRDSVGRMEPLEGERRPGTVSDEPFHALTVITRDADGGIDAEPTGSLPSEHAVGFVKEALGAEVAEHAALDDALEVEPVVGLKPGGFMKSDLTVRPLRECAIEDDTVEVEVPVQGRAEPVEEADAAERGTVVRSWAGAAERRADGPEEDPQDGACGVGVVVQEGPQPFWKAEHPLAHGQMGKHVVSEMRGDLGHAPCVARRADSPALARERDEPVVAAVLTAYPSKAVGEDAALQVGTEVPLHPRRNAVAYGVCFGGLDEEGLEVMLDDGIEWRDCGSPRTVDGPGRGPVGHLGWWVPVSVP